MERSGNRGPNEDSRNRNREFAGRGGNQADGNPASDVEAAGPDSDAPVQPPAEQFVTMKKSKKFIKFKDYIIKLPNSMGLIQSKNY